jgi:predicted nucleic acid-binding protein
MTDDKAILVDTNVLLSATAPLRPLHRAALTVLNDWPNQGMVLATTSQVLREYLVVETRPAEVNGLGLGVDDALSNVAAFRGRMRSPPSLLACRTRMEYSPERKYDPEEETGRRAQ